MAELDIRDCDDEIDSIRFSNSNIQFAEIIDYDCVSGSIVFDLTGVHFSDIDNLIKALQKAKEIWGKG